MFYPIDFFEDQQALEGYVLLLSALKNSSLVYPLSGVLKECLTFLLQETTTSLDLAINELAKTEETKQEDTLVIKQKTCELQQLKEQSTKVFADQSNVQYKDLLMLVGWEIEDLEKIWLPMAKERHYESVVTSMHKEIARLEVEKHHLELLAEVATRKKECNHYRYEFEAKGRVLVGMETRGVYALANPQELVRLKQELAILEEELKQRELQTKIEQVEHDLYRSEMKIRHSEIYAECTTVGILEDKRKEEILRKLLTKGTPEEFSVCAMRLNSTQDFADPQLLGKIFAPAILKLANGSDVAIYGTDNHGYASIRKIQIQEFARICPDFIFPEQEGKVVVKIIPNLVVTLQTKGFHSIGFILNANDLIDIDNDIIESRAALKKMAVEAVEEDETTEYDCTELATVEVEVEVDVDSNREIALGDLPPSRGREGLVTEHVPKQTPLIFDSSLVSSTPSLVELGSLRISDAAIEKLKILESGTEDFQNKAYKREANVYTIGYGHTKGVSQDMEIDKSQAERFLRQDLGEVETAVKHLVKVSLTQNQYDALILFTFNVGSAALGKSTLLIKLNAKEYSEVPKEMKRWIYAKDKMSKGLIARREYEAELFSTTTVQSKKIYKPK